MSDKHGHKSDQHQHHTLQYTALGDSIAFGVGGTDHYGYVNYFRDFLATVCHRVNLTNRAVPGFTSTDLLHQLQQDSTARQAIKKANLITISIGGGNLFNCLATPTPACFENGVLTFVEDWPRILKEIRKSIRSRAKILVMTVYNPLKCDDPNYNSIDFFIQQINQVIKKRENRSKYQYKVVNVHRDFRGTFTDGRCKVCTWTHFCELPPNVHPTDAGHLEIARLHELKFLKHC
ncbi:GDSL-type esterase/lipase family protein [Paenibacillus sp. KQZ6P-2]|uniref:GDSL-type esterase/lipase family protein n=1 Tax=Paenibacillus mangrovi TaxID=2931978 RepID=A0A9X2B184_9BACL|nr:GDSL-type esterase/lipase family protein [Paenibacillus mangrovi]MCJ8011026.1 GDSL-type esterase/lipase family protein [Paenibacillus mangrovi]